MKLRECRHGHIHIFHLTGEIDVHHAPDLRALFRAKAESKCNALVVDLSGIDFIDSTGIAVIIEYLRDATAFGGQFCMAGLTEYVREIFQIVGLDKAVPIFATLEESIAALHQGVPTVSNPLFGDGHRHAFQRRPRATRKTPMFRVAHRTA